jgi:hypothetical protein
VTASGGRGAAAVGLSGYGLRGEGSGCGLRRSRARDGSFIGAAKEPQRVGLGRHAGGGGVVPRAEAVSCRGRTRG